MLTISTVAALLDYPPANDLCCLLRLIGLINIDNMFHSGIVAIIRQQVFGFEGGRAVFRMMQSDDDFEGVGNNWNVEWVVVEQL